MRDELLPPALQVRVREIAARLREVVSSLDAAQLAALGVSEQHLLAACEGGGLSLDVVMRLGKECGVSLDWLLTGRGEMRWQAEGVRGGGEGGA